MPRFQGRDVRLMVEGREIPVTEIEFALDGAEFEITLSARLPHQGYDWSKGYGAIISYPDDEPAPALVPERGVVLACPVCSTTGDHIRYDAAEYRNVYGGEPQFASGWECQNCGVVHGLQSMPRRTLWDRISNAEVE